VSRFDLGLVTSLVLAVVAIFSLPPLPAPVELSLHMTVMIKGGGESSVNVGSYPCLIALYTVWMIWWSWGILFVMLLNLIFNRLRVVWLSQGDRKKRGRRRRRKIGRKRRGRGWYW